MNLPDHLLQHEDKILHWDGKWLVADGIDRNGESYPEIDFGLLHISCYDGEFWFQSLTSKEFYEDTDIFWKYVKKRFQLSKQEAKEKG